MLFPLRCYPILSCHASARACLQQRDRGDSDYHMSPAKDIEYRFYCEFQSHEPEFDYLKSLEIEEKINRIRWRHGKAGPLFLLSTNGAWANTRAQRMHGRMSSGALSASWPGCGSTRAQLGVYVFGPTTPL